MQIRNGISLSAAERAHNMQTLTNLKTQLVKRLFDGNINDGNIKDWS